MLGCGTWILPIGSFVWTLDLGFDFGSVVSVLDLGSY